MENYSVEKKDEIEKILIGIWSSFGMDIPNNYEDIVQFCYEDVCETADPLNWHSGDVVIAFRRWVESAKEKDTISVGVYYYIDNDGVYHFDEEEMTNELNEGIKNLIEKYKK